MVRKQMILAVALVLLLGTMMTACQSGIGPAPVPDIPDTDTTGARAVSPQARVYTMQGGRKLVVASGGELEVQSGGTLDFQSGATTDFSAGIDLDGALFDIDADGDTSIQADTDDQIDIEVSGADDFVITANTFTAVSGSTIALTGAARTTGWNVLPTRYELQWIAGKDGLVDVKATAGSDLIDPRFETLGTSASADDITFYAEGGLTLETDGADGDEVIILPHLDADQSAWTATTWGSDQETVWECWIKTGASITNAIIWAGLKLTNGEGASTDDDAVWFRYEDDANGGEWQAISSIATSDDAHDTNVAAATTTAYHLKIVIASDRTATMYINGVLVETTAALTDAIDLIPYIGVAADGAAAAKVLYIRGQAISRNYG